MIIDDNTTHTQPQTRRQPQPSDKWDRIPSLPAFVGGVFVGIGAFSLIGILCMIAFIW